MDASAAHQHAMLLQLIADARTTNYLAVAALTLLVFDYILGIPQEVELIWKTRRSVANVLYVWNRYFSLVALSINTSFMLRTVKSDKACAIFFHVEGTTITIVIAIVDLVLLLRVWILYGRSKTILAFLVPIVVAEMLTMFVLDVFVVLPMKKYVHLGPLLEGCYTLTVPRYYVYMSVPSLIVAFIMFALTVWKCGTSLLAFHSGAGHMPIMKMFLRDGVFWFLAVFAVMVPQMVITGAARPTLGAIMIAPCLAAYSIISSRVLLNIKSILAGGMMTNLNRTTNVFSTELPTIEFQVTQFTQEL